MVSRRHLARSGDGSTAASTGAMITVWSTSFRPRTGLIRGMESIMEASIGRLAAQAGYRLPLKVLRSAAGFYIGTSGDFGPVSRESREYFKTDIAAKEALESGNWTQRQQP